MKLKMILVFLFVLSTSYVRGMEEGRKRDRLNFWIDSGCIIKGYNHECSTQNISDYISPEKGMLGNKITKALSLNNHDSVALKYKISRAIEDKKTFKVPYAFNSRQFSATITPIFGCDKAPVLYVKITQKK